MKRTAIAGVAIVALLSGAQPGWTEDAADPQAAVKAQTEAVNAQTARISAETARLQAQTAALGLGGFEGKTTLEPNAGQMESWILSGGAIDAAAGTIAGKVKGAAGKAPVIIVSGEDRLNLGLPRSLALEISTLERSVNYVLNGEGVVDSDGAPTGKSCIPPKPAKPAKPANRGSKSYSGPLGVGATGTAGDTTASESSAALAAGGSILPVVGAVFDVLKADTTISGLTVAPDGRMLVNALAGRIDNSVLHSEVVDVGDMTTTTLGRAWTNLLNKRGYAVRCRADLAPAKDAKGVAARITALDGAIQAIDEFAVRVTRGDATTPGLLVQAAQLDGVSRGDPLVLRVSIEQAGGSLWKRDSVWTAIGFSGVRLTGGLVVSYRLVDPRTGVRKLGGVLVCRTDFASMKDIQAGKTYEPDCASSTAAKPRRSPSR